MTIFQMTMKYITSTDNEMYMESQLTLKCIWINLKGETSVKISIHLVEELLHLRPGMIISTKAKF